VRRALPVCRIVDQSLFGPRHSTFERYEVIGGPWVIIELFPVRLFTA
jgi:hypothetical protein